MRPECVGCDKPRVTVKCSCSKIYCDGCCEEHQVRKPDHRGQKFSTEPTKWQKAWTFVKGSVTWSAEDYAKDEGAKWFGLVEETYFIPPVCRIVETTRFAEIMEVSKVKSPSSPKRQYPSLVSFVGITGTGKSSLIRALIKLSANREEDLVDVDAPIVGNDHSFHSTTGEVNLYYDPETFGTSAPRLYVDCEGLEGNRPVTADYQKRWVDGAKGYRVESKDGRSTDRAWAVGNLYPKFIYIFSDVVCYVTRNPRGWATIVDNLLKWASVAAQHAINQYALPAVILVLNGPPTGNRDWIFGHPDTLTRAFFKSVEPQMIESAFVKRLADQYGVDSVEAIFKRCFSSVHVIYIPLKGYRTPDTEENLGSDENMWGQYAKLLARIKSDTERVQAAREERWMRFDSKQLTLAFHYAFKHLTSQSDKPFDFSDCRSQTDLPSTAQGHVTEFLKSSLSGDVKANFDYAASVLGSCIVIRALRESGEELFSHVDAVYDTSMRKMFQAAITGYLDTGLSCSYVDAVSGVRCINTKDGHAKGHQSKNGQLLADGEYQSGAFDSTDFQNRMKKAITDFLQQLDKCEEEQKGPIAKKIHRETINQQNSFSLSKLSKASSERTCFGCLFEAPEYKLPCGHFLCGYCISLFDQSTEEESYPSLVVHNECFLCSDNNPSFWPFRLGIRPPLSGVRVLSLDGGGVRGIIGLEIIKRLQKSVGLSIRPSAYFDLIVGTSAGGMIALGLGQHKWSIDKCISKYEDITRTGFDAKSMTKWWGIGWVARWFRQSIYLSKPFETALSAAFGKDRQLFGLTISENCKSTRNLPRVVVTTTVDKDLKVFANYDRGGSGDYLTSKCLTWEVARSTSAAPMYFEPFNNGTAGVTCRDGGLRQNNPLEVAFNEAKAIWGDDVTFDNILSVGTGCAAYPPNRPSSNFIIPNWLTSLFNSFMTTFNGQLAWESFYKMVEAPVKLRSKRLNLHFQSPREPALDDVGEVYSMKNEASSYSFRRDDSLPTVVHPPPKDAIIDVATQLRATLFYFHPSSIEFNSNRSVAVVNGAMYCRVETDSVAFRELHALTKGFSIPGNLVPLPKYERCKSKKFLVPVTFQHDVRGGGAQVDLRVKFADGYCAPISGFPVAFQEIQRLVTTSD